jgi:hypothetical protein
MPKQEIIKAKLIKNLLPLSSYQSPLDKSGKKVISNYMNDSKKLKEYNKIINKEQEIENENCRENKSTSLINNNYYIGINLDKKIINNICHTLRENRNYINCNLISNNQQPEINNENNNFIIIDNTTNHKKSEKFNNKDEDTSLREKGEKRSLISIAIAKK